MAGNAGHLQMCEAGKKVTHDSIQRGAPYFPSFPSSSTVLLLSFLPSREVADRVRDRSLIPPNPASSLPKRKVKGKDRS